MTSREMKDTAIFQDRRETKSKDVKVQFIDGLFEKFNVLDSDKQIKYFGIVTKDGLDNECSCPSFFYGMKYEQIAEDQQRGESRYVAENGRPFPCKHLIRATSLKMLGMKST